MSGKKQQHTADVETIPDAAISSELSTLRQIVFGAAQADIDNRLADLERSMLARFQETHESMTQHIKELTDNMHKGFDELHHQLSAVDKHYDDKTTDLQGNAEKLAAELEMSDTNHKQEHDELQSRLDSAVHALTEKYDAKFTEALDKLAQVTKELSSSKTDRKTLAKLLATMAVNLETDEQ